MSIGDLGATVMPDSGDTVVNWLYSAALTPTSRFPMARLARLVLPSLPHHITQRGNPRERAFFGDNGCCGAGSGSGGRLRDLPRRRHRLDGDRGPAPDEARGPAIGGRRADRAVGGGDPPPPGIGETAPKAAGAHGGRSGRSILFSVNLIRV